MRADYSNRRALVNGGVSALQVLAVSVALLVSYRVAVQSAGASAFGLYSLYFAFGTLTQVGSLGFGVGAARHVATAWGEERRDDLRPLLLLSAVTPLVGAVVMAVVIFAGLQWFGASSLSSSERALGASLAPLVLASACLAPVSTAAQGLVDGTSRAFVRGLVVISGAAVYLTVVVVALPSQGVAALAVGTLAQQGFVIVLLLGYVAFLTRGGAGRRWLPSNLRQVTAYNLKLHAVTVPTLAYEPVAKSLLQVFAGPTAVAYYEIANRLLQQVSALVHAANQAIVPVVAARASRGGLTTAAAFKKSFQVVFTLTMLSFGAALLLLPLLSSLVFGASGAQVLVFGAVLAVGWVSNCLCGPAYFIGVTLDQFRTQLWASYLVVVVVVGAGAGLGLAFGAYGVAVGVALALIGASTLVNVTFVRSTGVRLAELVSARDLVLVALTLVLAAGVQLASLEVTRGHLLLLVGAAGLSLMMIGAVAVTSHPVRADLRKGTDGPSL